MIREVGPMWKRFQRRKMEFVIDPSPIPAVARGGRGSGMDHDQFLAYAVDTVAVVTPVGSDEGRQARRRVGVVADTSRLRG
jgi:hypothetical protein